MSEDAPSRFGRQRLTTLVGWLATIAAVWAMMLALTGGVAIELSGWTVRSRNPTRAAVLATLLFVAYVAAGGRATVVRRLSARVPRAPRRPAPYLIALSIGFFGLTAAYGTKAVGGSDSYAYASMAALLSRGELTVEQPFALEAPWPNAPSSFSPLAYRPRAGDPSEIVPIVAPGYPALLALAGAIGGHSAQFLVAPLAGVILVISTFAIGIRLAGTAVALAAAWLVATSPIVLAMSLNVMTDVPAAAAWMVALYFVLGSPSGHPVAAGTATAFAVLIRPNLVPLAMALAFRYLLPDGVTPLRRRLVHGAIYTMAFLPGPIAMALLNDFYFGSPWLSGYGDTAHLFDRTHLGPNFRNYSMWLADAHTPAVWLGAVGLLLPTRAFWPQVSHRSVFVAIGAFVLLIWTIYGAYDVFPSWWFLRYMMPSVPLLLLGAAAVGAAGTRWCGRFAPVVYGAAIVALGSVQIARAADAGVFAAWSGERRFIVAAQLTRAVTGPRSVVLAAAHSGSLRYYGGRVTIRFHELPAAWLDRSVSWLRSHGVGVYAALEAWEVDEFRTHFAGAATLAALSRPIAVYDTPGHLEVFNLASPGADAIDPVERTGVPTGWRAAAPVPLPRLRLRP